ncbi:MAG: L-asparaginase 1 [Firmicutes bacterium ADurb.Bin182]|nr:MAG: L-asparaginase 1 [Firmicutes bacterium ADurb.Bin182]
MRNLRLIATGGTIASKPGELGLTPGLSAEDLLAYLDIPDVKIDTFDLFNMDSSNIQPEEWLRIANKVMKTSWSYDGVVITHGTDTMAYTASMLSFLLKGINIPVVLTGSQLPMVYPDSDGRKNLKNAITAAQNMPGGVYIVFGGAVIKGCRAVKVRTTSMNAFESINYPYVGSFANDCYIPLYEQIASSEFEYSDHIDPNVALIKLIPGTKPEIFEALIGCGVHGVVVEAFGLGGVHNFRRDHTDSIAKLISKNIPVVITSQCLYEISTPDLYEVSSALSKSKVISANDMTTEAAVTKLMWILGKTTDMDEIRKMMHTSFCGEITEPVPLS